MTKLHAHFDGRVLIPDEPVDLPRDCTLEVHVPALNKATQNFGAPEKLPTFSVPPGAPVIRSEDIQNAEDEYEMPTHLLDVNVLLALAWPNHEHYRFASQWFARQGRNGWATCPITQCAFVRISSNPKNFNFAVSSVQATEMPREMCRHPAHIFWPDDLEFADERYIAHHKITGHRQITDAYLLALAIRHGGVLATMDQGIASLAMDMHVRENLFAIGNES